MRRIASRAKFVPVTLDTKGKLRDARRLHSMTFTALCFARNCTLNGPVIASAWRVARRSARPAGSSRYRGSAAASTSVASPLWTPASSMCSLIGPKHDLAAVRDRVDLDLARVRLERGNHDRMLGRDLERPREDALQLDRLMRHAHRGAAQHIARADEHGKAAETVDGFVRLRRVGHVGPARLVDAEFVEQRAELAAVLRPVDVSGARPEDFDARAMQAAARGCSGIWPPMLTTTPSGCSRSQRSSTRLEADLVEDEPVADVVVGADGLRVVVEHDASRSRARTPPGPR